MAERVPLLLDTDIGSDIDDAVCLAYLLAEPRCELLGVSTVTGEAQRRAMLADALCRAAGRADVPVWSGAEAPLEGEQRQPSAPQAEVLARWEHRRSFPANDATRNVLRVISERPHEVTLLTIGPLTNVGLLFALDPDAPRLLRRMVMMAGRFFSTGAPEWNASGDVRATSMVFSSEVPEIWVYGLDVTLKCQLPAAECRERFRGGPLDVVADMAEVWFRERDRVTFHDPLAACCVFEPQLCACRRGRVSVEVQDRAHLGRTTFAESVAGRHRVAEAVDPERFFRRYFGAVQLFRRAAARPGRAGSEQEPSDGSLEPCLPT